VTNPATIAAEFEIGQAIESARIGFGIGFGKDRGRPRLDRISIG
jgi:hypothetical protein